VAARDPQGILFPTATPEGMAHYDQLIRQMSWFQAPVIDTIDAAIAANPAFAMPWIAKAWLHLYMTEPRFRDEAARIVTALRATVDPAALSDIERAHLAAIDAWIGGDLPRAGAILDRLGIDHPREVMGLRVGHELDFFAGATRNLRDRVARQITAWDAQDPHYGIVLGALAFGLEENGDYDRAEALGLEALAMNPGDAWAVHAVAHALEMRGQTGEGARFLRQREGDWAVANLFAGHNWWHAALFHLDMGDPAGALGIHDRGIYPPGSPQIAVQMLDSAALLWRAHLDGHDLGDRAARLSDDWAAIHDPAPWSAFNDMHAVMTHVAAGRMDRAQGLVAGIEAALAAGDDGTHGWRTTARVGLPVCRAILAYGAGQDAAAVDLLFPIRAIAAAMGGSAAQRDGLDRTLLAAATRGRIGGMARALASERVTVTPANPSNWARYADALAVTGARGPVVETARDAARDRGARARRVAGTA